MKSFAVFGNPIEHSISPTLHNAAFKHFNIDAVYSKILLQNADELKDRLSSLCGANITVPHKERAYQICDEIHGIAGDIKAVNTIIKRKNKLIGFNTDAGGFLRSIKEFQNIRSALILGAGGTAKAISYALKKSGIDAEILNRSQEKLLFFQENSFATYSYQNFMPKKYDIAINTTSAGLKDENMPVPKELLEQILKDVRFGFDVIYGKKTPFLSLCEEKNIVCKDGFDMLIHQAVLAFNLFFNDRYDEEEIVKAMKNSVL